MRELLLSVMSDSEKAMLRSQGGCGAGAAFSTSPNCALTRIEPPFFRTLLLRRLRLPLSLTQRDCRCGRPLDSCGHHRAACARSGVLGRRGFAVESAAARVCREGGAPVTTNILVRDMDVARPNPFDMRRLEVVADGLPLFGGAAVGLGHHTRVEFALRRVASAWSSQQRWCSVGRCADGRTERILSSSDSWRRPSRGRNLPSCAEGRSKHGG